MRGSGQLPAQEVYEQLSEVRLSYCEKHKERALNYSMSILFNYSTVGWMSLGAQSLSNNHIHITSQHLFRDSVSKSPFYK